MHRMLARLRLLEHKVAEFEQLVAALAANVHANEPEPRTYEVRRVADPPRTYVYLIEFKDQAASNVYASPSCTLLLGNRSIA